MSAPGPPGRFLVGNLPEFARDILGFMEHCARDYGDVTYLRLAGYPVYLLAHPDLIESVLVTHHLRFRKHRFFFRHVDAIFGTGLLTSEGSFWIRQRRLAQPAFHRGRIQAYGEVMVRHAERLMDTWKAGETRDVHRDMMAVTMQIVAETLFGAEVQEEVSEIGEAFDAIVQEIAVRFRRPIRIPDGVSADAGQPALPARRSAPRRSGRRHHRPSSSGSARPGRSALHAAQRARRGRQSHDRPTAPG